MSTPNDISAWPIGLKRLAEVIGPAGAVKLADTIGGGNRIYIPKTPTATNRIALIIGIRNLRLLSDKFGGEWIEIPRGTFKDLKKVAIMDADGNNEQIASRVGCTVRYVRKILNETGVNSNQLGLFDTD